MIRPIPTSPKSIIHKERNSSKNPRKPPKYHSDALSDRAQKLITTNVQAAPHTPGPRTSTRARIRITWNVRNIITGPYYVLI